MFEGMYEHSELTHVRFVGFHSEHSRYDFGIIFTNSFFGNPLVVDMQTGRSILLNPFDASNKEWIKQAFQIDHDEDAENLVHFFQAHLPSVTVGAEY
jgi:hypothetical protein